MYLHDAIVHNQDDPNEIVPLLNKYFNPSSVIDLGCGIGNFLSKFKELGVKKVLGIDGAWSDNEMQMLQPEDLLLKNISDELHINDKFDLAMSLEVGEHLEGKYASKIINDLTGFSDLIVFSAAIPNQGGQDHVNEQWPDYWVKIFNTFGYDCYDLLRPILWSNPNVHYWYAQNMFIAVRSSNAAIVDKLLSDFPFLRDKKNVVPSLVHPLQLQRTISETRHLHTFRKLVKGQGSIQEYKEFFKSRLTRK
ncbi:methyltransferase domain-containing protein [Hufsiella ginkgonis]|uniref:Methyltransferase domain-containing protein n=1 Tax=Hufsiella ginkgonis TaxID=2695274 RepID=A0A7K1Y0U4_9SPHI|nr:class I SAM-dependent methyltransferase [Hufsiella ginkgonis]MXV16708.1 methyltransferase domain-containing protein [Hufsiella ginkgonis]